MRKVICPDCQHEFDFNSDRDFVFCEFCGRKIDLAEADETDSVNGETIELSNAPETVPEPVEDTNEADEEEAQTEQLVPEKKPGEDGSYIAPVPVPMQLVVQQPAQAIVRQPASQPVQQVPVQPVRPASEKLEAEAKLSTAIKCYNTRDYKTANECLKLLKESEPENFEVWFCACKVLAAEKPGDVKTALNSFVEAAANCVKFAPEGTGVKGNLTVEYNKMLKNATGAITRDQLYFVPYDRNVMSEDIPSFNYQPLAKVDDFYFTIMENIKAFQDKVNPNYLTNYFLDLWDNCFFCCAHEITSRMVKDFNSSKLFAWYQGDMKNHKTNEAVLNAFCDLLYGYKKVFITLFNRLPYKDTKTQAVNRIAYVNKWLLKMRRTDPMGRSYLFVPDPGQRAALEQEIRNYKIMLSQS